jgi:hypothetical protein
MIKSDHSWRLLAAFSLAACLLTIQPLVASEPLKSGLQPGEEILGLFEPLNVTGPYAGEPHCLVCENGANPVAMVFARMLSEPLVQLLAKLDKATAKQSEHQMGSFAVFLSEDEQLAARLEQTAKKQNLKQLILATDAPTGPEGFKVAEQAEVTVVLYRQHTVIANHAFRRGELNDKAIERIIADVPRLAPEK